jgi:hypothetical protein
VRNLTDESGYVSHHDEWGMKISSALYLRIFLLLSLIFHALSQSSHITTIQAWPVHETVWSLMLTALARLASVVWKLTSLWY